MKLSIITPYYNTLSDTLKLAEVLKPQLNEDVEWLIIDDGCYEKKLDDLATVIHIPHFGNASRPRNVGLDHAKGEYISFIDSDDLVSKDYIEKIFSKMPFDYCLLSWKSDREVIIDNLPPEWNTCVWNTVYSRKLIGDTRFDESLNIGEDEKFNYVRKGLKKNITDILYYYNSRPSSLTHRYSRKEITKETFHCNLLVYQKYVSKIGGIETFLYNFFTTFKDYDITFVYREADPIQLERFKKLVRCIKFNEQTFVADYYLCASTQDNICDFVTAPIYYDMIHADLDAMKWPYHSYKKTTNHIAVSNLVKKAIEKQDSRPTQVIYNLLPDKKGKKPILIYSAQRVSKEKGEEQMKHFAKRMREKGVPFLWVCFTDNKIGEEEGIIFKSPVLDLENYIQGFDYFASFSDTESYGYSLVEALHNGVPAIVRDIPILDEIGFTNEMGYRLNKDLSNMDEVIDQLYNIPKFSYTKLDDKNQWLKLFNLKPSTYKEELKMKYKVRATSLYKDLHIIDSQLGYIPNEGEEWVVTKERLDILTGKKKFVSVIEEIKEEENGKENVKREVKRTTKKAK